jgi:hypothetical protein
MKHLTPQQFVEALDGTLAPPHLRHLEACETCRQEVSDLRVLMGDVHLTAQAAEPSPLFWDHFSRRVHAATSVEPLPHARAWWQDAWRPLIAVGAILGMVAVIVSVRLGPFGLAQQAPLPTGVSVLGPANGLEADVAVPSDGPWDLVSQIASNLSWDEAKQAAEPTRDVTGDAVEQLTPLQRAEFVRLVKAQMGGAE